MKKIGVFGGSFDPPHLGHLWAALYALKTYPFDQVWFVPTLAHPFGKTLSPFSTRIKMCDLLLKDVSSKFRVSKIEKKNPTGRTLLMLQALKKQFPSCHFTLVLGSDLMKDTKRWYRFGEIKRKFGVCLVPRIPALSSTKARKRRSKLQSLRGLLPKAVESYVIQKRLYRS